MHAASQGNAEILDTLLRAGARVDVTEFIVRQRAREAPREGLRVLSETRCFFLHFTFGGHILTCHYHRRWRVTTTTLARCNLIILVLVHPSPPPPLSPPSSPVL
jgi:hypothetical protein